MYISGSSSFRSFLFLHRLYKKQPPIVNAMIPPITPTTLLITTLDCGDEGDNGSVQ